MKQALFILIFIVIAILLLAISGALFTINESQQVVVTQFGKPVGKPITEAGLHFKMPFIQQANYFDKWILEWDGEPTQVPTKDKKYISVDTTARWRIKDALEFLQSVGNEMGGQARLDDIIDSATRDTITSHNLVEAVRDSNRIIDDSSSSKDKDSNMGQTEELEKISFGRDALTRTILEEASKIVPQYGIELIDVRIKRINYVADVQTKVFERMISERKRAAEQYRSEGEGKKAEIQGKTTKELRQIQSEAYRVAEGLKGKADAEATKIYADAYNKSPAFYAFLKTLETYKNTIDETTTLILTTDSEYYNYIKNSLGLQ